MEMVCTRCGRQAAPPPAQRVPFTNPTKDRILGSICAACWAEWEGTEIKVINEYRLSFMDPQHRDMLRRSCLEFLKLPLEG
jgi:Fe-S cluster biosynthesis and repair protein YggX